MSTRCQVEILDEGMEYQSGAMLYHHCDGYPTNMLPLIAEGYKLSGGEWKAGRAGKAAAFIVASDPDGFEVEDQHELHGDIEWFYQVTCKNTHGGSLAEKPEWHVKVHETSMDVARKDLKVKSVVVFPRDLEAIEDIADFVENGGA